MRVLPRKSLIPSIILAFFLADCGGGFQTIKPDPDQIMSITNQNFTASAADRPPANSPPIPIPNIPPGRVFEAPPAAPKDEILVNPLNSGKKLSAAAIGDVTDADINVNPFDAAAKLAFIVGNSGYSCTAEFVGDSGDVIMTAAHCVYDQSSNTWGKNFTVYLGYKSGTQKAIYGWQCAAIYTGWPQKDYGRDFAFIKVRGKASDSMGIRLGFGDGQWTAIGYPAKYGSAEILKRVDGTRGSQEGRDIQMLHNSLSHGASGGAWIVGSYAVGLNSYVHTNDDSNMFGPIFDGNVSRLYQFVRNGCTEDIIPIGQSIRIQSYDPAKAFLETDSVDVQAGPVLKRKSKSPECPCSGSDEFVIDNRNSDNDYEADVEYQAAMGDPPEIKGTNRLRTSVNKRSELSLGCSLGDKKGNLCPLSMDYVLQQIRRKISVPGAKSAAKLTTVNAAFCADQCVNNRQGGYCLEMGKAASNVLVPLAGFVSSTINNNTNGVVATKRDMIIQFKGDPDKEQDPCSRSDFFRKDNFITNDGIGCRTTSPVITDLPGEPRLSLRSPPSAQATRIASISSPMSEQADFQTRGNAPVLEFYGKNADQINALYGGHIASVQRVKGLLVVTTEFGCSAGADK